MTENKLYPKAHLRRRAAGKDKPKADREPYRSAFRQDYARLIHCPSYRRLQGKTQLFPGHESDFFRNRLTHSHEVAQIAKSIAIRLNSTEVALKLSKMKIDCDLVEFAALAHDIGHPPFGHNGEHALDQLLLGIGGYEGNAQTLRIISRLEKKVTKNYPFISSVPTIFDEDGDSRLGLNPTYRTLASVIKYDNIIPYSCDDRKKEKNDDKPVKGIYYEEKNLLDEIKGLISHDKSRKFKTVECHVMDTADDIAYSTYDIEDAMKAGFLTPIKMISMPDQDKEKIVGQVRKKINAEYSELKESDRDFDINQLNNILLKIFSTILNLDGNLLKSFDQPISVDKAAMIFSGSVQANSSELCANGYYRTGFTSELVGEHIRNVEYIHNTDHPSQSVVRLKIDSFKKVESLKIFAFNLLIDSPRLKIAERRGHLIINKIFDEIVGSPDLLPEDWRNIYRQFDNNDWHQRTVADFIAGMTDRYCSEMYSRLTSDNPISFWKEH